MTKWQYVGFCLTHSFLGSNSKSQTVALLCMFAGGMVAYFDPTRVGSMSVFVWAVPLAIFVAIFAFKWTFAPYHFVQESADKMAGLQGDIAQEREKQRDQARQYQARAEKNEEAYKVQFHELTSENERLRNDCSPQAEAMERVKHVRQALLKHADDAPSPNGYEPESGSGWMSGAAYLVDHLVGGSIAGPLWTSPNPTYAQLQFCVASLRAIASNLKIEDLRRK